MQESRDKGRTKTNGESDASFGGLGARPAMEGWRWTDPFVGRRGGDATPGTALRCRRAGRALGSGVREVANTCPPPPRRGRRATSGRERCPDAIASASLLRTRMRTDLSLRVSRPDGWIHQYRANAQPHHAQHRRPPGGGSFIKYGRPGEFPGVPFP